MPRYLATLLLAVFLLSPPLASAQFLPPVPTNSSTVTWHTVTFRYAKPDDVLLILGYAGNNKEALPQGVTRVIVVPDTQSFQVNATNAGFRAFEDRLDAALSIRPKQVQFRITLASLPKSHQVEIDLSHPRRALTQMREAGAAFDTLLPVTVDDGGSASIPVDWDPLDYLSPKGSGFKAVPTVSLQPNIADDGTVFLGIDFQIPGIYVIPIYDDGAVPQERHSTVMAISDATGGIDSASNRVLIFVTPTVVVPPVNDGEAITVTP